MQTGGTSGQTGARSLSLHMDRAVISGASRLLDPGRAELELGDLAERVERGVGEEVGGGLGVAEGDEDEAGGDVAVGAGGEIDGAAAGRDADGIAGGDAELPQVAGGEVDDGFG